MNTNLSRVLITTAIAVFAGVFLAAVQASDMTGAGANSRLIIRGEKQWAAGDLDGAQQDFEQAGQVDPNSVEAFMKLGGLQLARNDFGHSILTYQHVIGLDQKNVRAWMGMGIAYMHTGQNELSLAAFGEAVRLDPTRREQLAVVMDKLNKRE